MAGGSALLKKRPLLLGALALLVALAIAVTLAVTKPWASTKDRDDVAAPAAGDRVLQSVDVTMQPDGALTRVNDTVVIARAAGGASDTYATTYDPTKVVDQLPVRVLTTYQTDQGSGTNLADLKGYSGRVTINLAVQNLTVTPQEITYDVAGKSRTTTAQVGVPLTVVASAALPGIDPATIVTAAADAPADSSSDTSSTNGVLSKAADGTTQVQWASILAPPQLDATATFRVVLDAKDFTVPTVDLSVQPGLVTDPSVGALIDSAFNPKNSDELTLETRTIALIGDVNDVLGRASGTISGVRKTLDASSKTLGTKTVQSLTEDTKTIGTSLKSSSDDIDSLGDSLQDSLKTTQSATLQRMSETVSGLQDLIGDTSASEPSVQTDGEGCATTVKASGGGSGVYGNLLRVSAQLQAYAASTADCKTKLVESITTTIGVIKPTVTDDDCVATAPSVVLSLQCAQREFASAVGDVNSSIDSATISSAELDPDPERTVTSAQQLREVSGDLAVLVDGLVGDKATTEGGEALQKGVTATQLKKLEDTLKALTTTTPTEGTTSLRSVDAALARSVTTVQEINSSAVDGLGEVDKMVAQNSALATTVCSLRDLGQISDSAALALRLQIVGHPCGSNADAAETTLGARLEAQRKRWTALESQTKSGGQLLKDLGDSRASLRAVIDSIDDTRKLISEDRAKLEDVLDRINEARKQADKGAEDLDSLSDHVAGVQLRYSTAQATLTTALDDAKKAASTAQAVDLQEEIQNVATQGERSTDELGKAFTSSAEGLASAAEQLQDGTAQTLKKQSDDLADQQKSDQADLNDKTKAGLSTISGSVTSATRDIDTTRTSLTKDLNNVLLDLGNPKQPGKGLLGTLSKSARSADSADYQLGLASDKVSSYSSVRSQEVGGIMLRQAQAEAALQRQAELPAFATELPANTTHRTIYEFHLGGDR